MENMVFITNGVCYNRDMPVQAEKKSEQVLVNLTPSAHAELAEIAEIEDRKMGYVARELMIRGLALYRQDGQPRNGSVPKKVLATAITVGKETKRKLRHKTG